jgi:hypothetical protein
VAGGIGYVFRRGPGDPDEVTSAGGAENEPPVSEPRRPSERRGPSPRLWPVVAVAAACLLATVTTRASDAGWAALAVGLLGLAVGWALLGQDRRIRELEREVRRLRDGADDGFRR